MDLIAQGARALSQTIRSGAVSPVDVMRATLERIDAVNGPLNAIVALRDRESLMGQARLAEAMPAEGWLHGIPVAVKDLADVKGIPSTSGAPDLAQHIPTEDSGLARRLRAAGAIIIGKTNVPMFGLGGHTKNAVYGPSSNPFDLALTPGGSSGGAAQSLITGMLTIADGSDMMGSLRNPGAWNNVYGFRPSVGLVPGDDKNQALIPRLSTNGPMARSIGDLEALLRTLSDGVYSPGAAPKAPRIGWLGDWGGAFPMESGLMERADWSLKQMADLGWSVEEVAPPMASDALWDSWTDLRSFVIAIEQAPRLRDPAIREGSNAQIIWETERGLALGADRVERALRLREDWLATVDALFQRFDALVSPSTQLWPFPIEWAWPEEINGTVMDTYHRWMEVVVPASLAGLPALNLPAGFGANGLPAGMQLIGKRGQDAAILAMARQYEEAIGPREIVTPKP